MPPIDDFALGIERGLDLDRHRRAERCVRHLVLAGPHHPHRPAAGGLREQHGVERHVIGGVVPVAAGAFHVCSTVIFSTGSSSNQRQIGAATDRRPGCGSRRMNAVGIPLRHRAGRRDRSMRYVGAGILPPDAAPHRRSGRRCSVVDDGQFGRLGLQECCQVVFHPEQRFAVGPRRALAQGEEGCLGAMLGFANDACQRNCRRAPHRDDAGHCTGAVLVQAVEFCARMRRAQHSAVQRLAGNTQS